ncbi:hypothetical protein H257_06307 [Aphanomyces astaci]|uniref:Cysteine dioxygenase n=1 Tax=Aphanomyces astaci TaxID=112090 RepID=W4GMB8_APHAT|nr:hypothetical protein H257_06307 [Aphanomyces astaci]ETV80850.1 hypothetical protein H257_06307 [Aphanomyces astaci]RQM21012.1 hypothetical protein B5M09_000171 [Aphanomyces astaci]|eukprot:XP_009829797.1 hypothetical protein H257_06307 [Aphanomyces astaci]
MSSVLNSSSVATPASVAPKGLTLRELVDVIESEFERQERLPLNKKDDIKNALAAFNVDSNELKRYAHFDPSRNYTRNLIATDNATYALMLLCWNKGKYSPIHDHPSDGCWVRHIQGTVHEVRYWNNGTSLEQTSELTISEGVTYMDDSLGLHKIGNPSDSTDAITLHLYAPPYDKCRLWFNPTDATKSSTAIATFYSEFGDVNQL